MQKNQKPMFAPIVTFTQEIKKNPRSVPDLKKYASATIMDCLRRAVYLEEYEEAAIYRDELKRRAQAPAH